MTKLTTERLDKLQDNLLQFQVHYSDPADKENYDIFVDALHMLDEFKEAKEKILAYEQAGNSPVSDEITIEELQYRINAHESDLTQMWTADYFLNVQKELLALKQAAKNPVAFVDERSAASGGICWAKSGKRELPHGTELYAAPVLPKQPEHSRQQFESLCNQFWNWAEFDEINHDEDPLLEWNGSNYTNRVTAALWKMYQAAPAQPVIPEHCQMTPDEMLCDFYEVSNWPDLVRELVKHVEQLQESAKRNVKPWEDTFPETLLPAYVDRITRANDACRAEMLKNGKSASTELPNHSELSTDSPVIPDGWKLVPIEPTAAMFHAFNDDDYGRKSMRERYIQMIEAAPAQESE